MEIADWTKASTSKSSSPAHDRRAFLVRCLALAPLPVAAQTATLPGPAQDGSKARIALPAWELPIALRRVRVDTAITGRAAKTRVELELLNPNRRVLEGELQLPLQPGHSVTGFALYIDGELRPAVPV